VELAELLHVHAEACHALGRDRKAAALLRRALRALDGTTAHELRGALDARLAEVDEGAWMLHSAGRFVGHEQIEFLLAQAGQTGFRGRQEQVTVLFSDLRQFTTVSEGLDPETLIEVLNRYLERMTRCVEHFGGMVDKFIGDAVMALFTLPTPRPDDADRAVAAALFMQAELERVNRSLPRGIPRLATGVGLHTGRVVAGLIGSPRKRAYTVIGDAVNTASRLEGMTKILGAPTLVTREVRDRLADPDRWLLGPLGRYRPKGRRGTVEVYQVLGERDGPFAAPAAEEEIAAARQALDHLAARAFGDAARGFEALATARACAPAAKGYAALAAHARAWEVHPPPAAWDGAIELTEK
jgi:adenylate cyclase